MALSDDLERIAAVAEGHADAGEHVAAVIAAEPRTGIRIYLCAFESEDGRTWLGLDEAAVAVTDRELVHDAVTIAALCELAEESAAGGDVPGYQERLAELGQVEGVELVEAAQSTLAALDDILEEPPRVATPVYLDRIGLATRRFEQALGELGTSPFAEAMKQGAVAVEGLAVEVLSGYKAPLDTLP
jgi:hypothetical protein